jgi:hypothetical protein
VFPVRYKLNYYIYYLEEIRSLNELKSKIFLCFTSTFYHSPKLSFDQNYLINI